MKLGDLPGNTALVMCEAVFDRTRSLQYVAHEEDGPQAICDLNHGDGPGLCGGKVVALQHLFEWEPDLECLKTLQYGEYALKRDGVWEVGQLEPGKEH